MKKLLLFFPLFVFLATRAQVRTVSLQASGLTCSMCSNAINNSLKTLDFVQEVNADLKTYSFTISFRPGSAVDFDKIRNKVESAGFTVCAFVATVYFDNVRIVPAEPVVVQDKTFLFDKIAEQVLQGEIKIRLLDKGFVSAKEFKRSSVLASSGQIYHVAL